MDITNDIAVDHEIGGRIIDARQRRGLTQVALAQEMRSRGHNWVQATVWNVEQGRRPLRAKELAPVGDALGISTPFLLGFADSEGDAYGDGYRDGLAMAVTAVQRELSRPAP